jgi:hypothetical protein
VRWGCGLIVADKEKIDTLLQVVRRLVNEDVIGDGVIIVFHERRVLSLMRRARRLDEMVPNAPLKGTVLVIGALDHEEIMKHIKSVLESIPSNAALDVHPPMCPDDGFIEMVSTPTLPLLLSLGFLCSLSIA